MKDFFKELFEYSHHYNQKLIEIIQINPENISDKALKIFSHILNAHHVWNNRLIESSQNMEFGRNMLPTK